MQQEGFDEAYLPNSLKLDVTSTSDAIYSLINRLAIYILVVVGGLVRE